MPRCRFCDHDAPAGLKDCPSCGAELPETASPAAGGDLDAELLDLIDRGNTIEAIKRYRDATGAGLAAAKEQVESLIAARSSATAGRIVAAKADPPSEPGFETELLDLLSQGRKIDAIKLHRERTRLGLKESKEAVEALAARHGLAAKGSGCLGMLLFATTAAASVVAMVW